MKDKILEVLKGTKLRLLNKLSKIYDLAQTKSQSIIKVCIRKQLESQVVKYFPSQNLCISKNSVISFWLRKNKIKISMLLAASKGNGFQYRLMNTCCLMRLKQAVLWESTKILNLK